MTAPGYYDQSLPPSLWAPAAPVGAARRATADGDPAVTFTVAAGAPGSYDPEVKAAGRPRNITELRERALPADEAPWTVGQYVLVGENGKRAHWDGEEWQYGEGTALISADADSTVPDGTVPAA